MNEWSPIVSEFASEAEAESYRKWLEAKVAASLADPTPPLSHDEAMRAASAIIAAKTRERRQVD